MLQPPEDLVPDRLQTALTKRFLLPALPSVEAALLEIRAETDAILAPGATARRDKPYPYGYCYEITADVIGRLRQAAARRRSPGERALDAFFRHGGRGTLIWGALRGLYLQNAIQFGPLYVDVSNDTVDVNKAKVEILPMAESGFELLRDAAHFAQITELYWGVRTYANTVLPALAPLFPMLIVDREERVLLQSKTGYMMRLFGTDGFRRAERWLREGPPAPEEIERELRVHCPEEILAASPVTGVEAAVSACRELREARTKIDEAWVSRMAADFDRVPMIRIMRAASRARGEATSSDANPRSCAGVAYVAA